MIGRKTEAVLNRAVRYAVDHGHEYFTLEHVLWSLLAEQPVVDTVQACGADLALLRKDLEAYLGSEIPKALALPKEEESSDTTSAGAAGDSEGKDSKSEEGAQLEHPVATLSIQRLIQRALFHVQSAGKDDIQPIDLFVAMFQAKDSHALFYLGRQGIERLDVLNFVSHGMPSKAESVDSDEALEGESLESQASPAGSSAVAADGPAGLA